MPLRLPELGTDPQSPFPPIETALRDPDGLLAWGGGLEPERLLIAYRHGCFPWFEAGQPILWWSPDPRLVLRPDRFHVSRSFSRALRRSDWTVTADTRFGEVIRHCALMRRRGQHGTWILPTMIDAYERLHHLGHAHCFEVIDCDGRLVGGIYGVAIGRMFFGESMVSLESNGSKVALLALCRYLAANGFPMIDCQMETAHLASLGATTLRRDAFLEESRQACSTTLVAGSWQAAFGRVNAPSLLQAKA